MDISRPENISRPDNIARIGLIGGECTGKSTTATALAELLAGVVAHEVLREFVAEHGRVPDQAEQRRVMLTQMAREDSLIASPGTRLVIADPMPAMTALYSDVYYADSTLLPVCVEHAARYDLVLWCRPDIPWVADPGQRDGPEYRALVDERIAMFVRDDLTPAGIDVIELSGRPEHRLAIAQAALNGLAIPPFRAWQPPASDPAK